ncbi:3-hydroxyacyl-CoA dehydrogenase family protein [Aspergillus vadensis CBS 113365]|uniref:L-gulonate 3-dehydrogenase n=1 Tax=Aspergillus vadensis (strain CBS 113365 / IMI 142717 / IBT 24658) TaxID=1448311 RepID=A0A319BPR4_ASPVC|nr:3-hydroxyacyl-CoA dehyrogenase [Aspergillus vadensis CBS 113365]PYH74675.1 3-hydroxyacyl-CoA dehyrogenase [Aspergillus vadensis CBS 113365]
MSVYSSQRIALIGLGTIGISMAALHLSRESNIVDVFDTRPDFEEYIHKTLPIYMSELPSTNTDPRSSPESQPSTSLVASLVSSGRLQIHSTLESACASATIVQEQGPENVDWKQTTWAGIEAVAPSSAHFWTSTSGIAASIQQAKMQDKSRLLVVHPFNPPNIMPLLEIVPAPETSAERVEFAQIPGFVGNRLAFALLREACYLVQEDVVDAKDLDTILMASLGPRWAGNGVFESYQYGGGKGGIGSFLDKLGGTMQTCWDAQGRINVEGDEKTEWKEKVIAQVNEAYGTVSAEQIQMKEARLKDIIDIQMKGYSRDGPEV